MPLGRITTPPPQTTPTSESPATSQSGQATAGTLENRAVRADTGNTGRIATDPRQVGSSTRETLGAAAPGATGFTNRSSAPADRTNTRRAGLLARLGRNLKNGLRKLLRTFSRRQTGAAPAQTARTSTVAAPGAAQFQRQMQEGLAFAARSGIDATKRNLNDKILGGSTNDVLSALTGGDKGIRRATTAMENLKSQLRPEQLPPESLHGMPQQWTTQSRAISRMAGQIGNAGFSEEANGRFLDYGTSGEANPFNDVAKNHPELDRPVRNWLTDGVNLLDQLLTAQERAFNGEPPLNNDQIAGLQAGVDNFRNAPLADPQIKGLADEAIHKFDTESAPLLAPKPDSSIE